MLRLPALFAAALGVFAAPVAAAPVATITVALGSATPVVLTADHDPDSGRFGGSFVLCDGSVRVGATACASPADSAVVIEMSGSIFPEITGTVSFFDAGAPTSLTVTFGALIPVIPGLADAELSGSFTVPQDRETPPRTVTALPGLPFVWGGVLLPGPVTVLEVGDDPLTLSNDGPVTLTWDPITGTVDCASGGGCESIFLSMGFVGLGGDTQYQIGGRFDIDAAPTAPVPLPAPLALLAAGLGLMGLAGRRRG